MSGTASSGHLSALLSMRAARRLPLHPSWVTPRDRVVGGPSGKAVDLQPTAREVQGAGSTLWESDRFPSHQEPVMFFHDPDTLHLWINIFFAVALASVVLAVTAWRGTITR